MLLTLLYVRFSGWIYVNTYSSFKSSETQTTQTKLNFHAEHQSKQEKLEEGQPSPVQNLIERPNLLMVILREGCRKAD